MAGDSDLRTAAARLPNGQLALEGIATAGQPEEADFARLAEAGYRVVVDLRGPRESRGFREEAAVREAGMEYVNLPVLGPPSDETLEALRQLLRDPAKRPALVHCGSANRVGGALIPYLVLDEGRPREEAMDAAARIGLRSPELAERAMEYLESRQAQEPSKQGKTDDPQAIL